MYTEITWDMYTYIYNLQLYRAKIIIRQLQFKHDLQYELQRNLERQRALPLMFEGLRFSTRDKLRRHNEGLKRRKEQR